MWVKTSLLKLFFTHIPAVITRSTWGQADVYFLLFSMPASHTCAKLTHSWYGPLSLVILTLVCHAEKSDSCKTSQILHVLLEVFSHWVWLMDVINVQFLEVLVDFQGAEHSHPSATWGNSSEVKRWHWLSSSSSQKRPTVVSVNWERSGWCSFVM